MAHHKASQKDSYFMAHPMQLGTLHFDRPATFEQRKTVRCKAYGDITLVASLHVPLDPKNNIKQHKSTHSGNENEQRSAHSWVQRCEAFDNIIVL
jgi:hypothetical protein